MIIYLVHSSVFIILPEQLSHFNFVSPFFGHSSKQSVFEISFGSGKYIKLHYSNIGLQIYFHRL